MGLIKLAAISGLAFLNWVFYNTILTSWFSQFGTTTQIMIASISTLLLVILIK